MENEKNIPVIDSQSISTTKSKFRIILMLAGLLSIFVFIIGIWIGKTFLVSNDNLQIKAVVPTITVGSGNISATIFPQAKEKIPVIIYTEEMKGTDTSTRHWTTVKIMRKKGNKESEELAVVGKENEYPSDFVLSPDRKYLLINLETKLQLLNLQTKQLEDLVFLKKNNFRGAIFSQDAKKILIWDQDYASQDKEYIVHVLDVETKKDQVIKTDVLSIASYLYPLIWRNDNMVLLVEPRGEIANLWLLDLKNNSVLKPPKSLFVGNISQSGKLMSVPKFSVSDSCNAMTGSAAGSFEIIEPITGELIDKVGDDKKEINLIEFSKDDKEVLYSEVLPILTIQPKGDDPFGNCTEAQNKRDKTRTYYVKNLINKSVKQITDLSRLPSEWDGNYIGAGIKFVNNKSHITYLGKNYIISGNNLELKAQFFE